jgi:WD40 repeat protein
MEFRGNSGQHVSSADLSPDGKRVVTSTEGGTWLIWDATTGIQLTTIHASIGPLRGALFTSDGKQILTVGTDDQVRVWKSLDRDPSIRLAVDPALLKGIKR